MGGSMLVRVARLQRLSRADLLLDSAHYNSHTSAADALWAGLPLLTLPGTHAVAAPVCSVPAVALAL
jgi:predicted O-linked N-acetylglucosamine transferase (SPINDLY family)